MSQKIRIYNISTLVTCSACLACAVMKSPDAIATIAGAYLIFAGAIAGARAWEQNANARKGGEK